MNKDHEDLMQAEKDYQEACQKLDQCILGLIESEKNYRERKLEAKKQYLPQLLNKKITATLYKELIDTDSDRLKIEYKTAEEIKQLARNSVSMSESKLNTLKILIKLK